MTAVLLLGACASLPPESMKTAAPGESFTLQILQSVRIEPGGTVLQFSEVASDSRCPVDVTCVWEGNAEVVLRATGSGDDSAELRLGTHEPRTARFGGLAIELVSVAPLPKEGLKPRLAEYEVTLRVNRA